MKNVLDEKVLIKIDGLRGESYSYLTLIWVGVVISLAPLLLFH